MSSQTHRTQTIVRHWIELLDHEQYRAQQWNGKPAQVSHIYCEVVDGNLRNVTLGGRRFLASGLLGARCADISMFRSSPDWETTTAVLRARGIRTPGSSA